MRIKLCLYKKPAYKKFLGQYKVKKLIGELALGGLTLVSNKRSVIVTCFLCVSVNINTVDGNIREN